MNDFRIDNAWQLRMRDTILEPQFYGRYALNGRYVFMDKGRLASILQKRYAVDTIIQSKTGAAVTIEEKIVRWPGYVYDRFALETESCTVPGYESPGWMRYGKADYLLYCFETEAHGLDTYLIDFEALREWFWPLEETFKVFQMKERNRTRGRLVPVAKARESVPTWRFELTVEPA